MLTLPAEPHPQTGLMDSLPAVTSSFVSYGVSGSRRSPRKNHVMDRRVALKPYGKPISPTRKPRFSPSMVQMDPSVPSRFETSGEEASHQEQLNFSVATETVQEKLQRPPISPRVSSLNHTVPSCGMTSDPLETRSLLAPDSAPKGWVIGPLFQSFRSKMASFTEIVMSPVKLFKSNSTESDVSASEPTAIENTDESLYSSAEGPDRICGMEEPANSQPVIRLPEVGGRREDGYFESQGRRCRALANS
ncbi:uncharacterized protein LOC117375300 [Periophthalmus magnuspinnatus]|uniref:uncharacterized protein LOC117375300 n=1 Tax=Periophthalmus magnuspinnatus TaxID=409849 RepID=UPI0024365F82|nr:uncharacterized protein LOC117375300 [Periophthalmus magnuspinnatus]